MEESTLSHVYAKPSDERAFLEGLINAGVDVTTEDVPYKIYDRVTLCYWSKSLEQPREIPCYVMGRKLAHNATIPHGIKVRVGEVERILVLMMIQDTY